MCKHMFREIHYVQVIKYELLLFQSAVNTLYFALATTLISAVLLLKPPLEAKSLPQAPFTQ